MKRLYLAFWGIVTVFFIVAGYNTFPIHPATPISSNTVSADLIEFPTLEALSGKAEAIVVGTFNNKPPRLIIQKDMVDDAGNHRTLNARGIQFEVREVLKGQLKPNTIIEIVQRVGVNPETGRQWPLVDNAFYESQPGEEYLLFVGKSSMGNYYWVTGHYQGAFRIKDGKVDSANTIGLGLAGKGVEIKKTNIDEFLNQLRLSIK